MYSKETETDKTIEAILEGIRRIKGKEITLIDLSTIHHTECDWFIICHGNSSTQTDSIAHSVEETVEELTGIKTWHTDGYKNSIWILLDYGNIMVHVFQKSARDFYKLEELWSDASLTKIEEEN
ncbi:MAG: ribosome silencing factor [Bacteroidia bacterium]|nr:ribosome silencing factor [Bacteroidia bacterium]